VHEAVEGLLNLEKSSRLAEDITATKASCAAVLDVCFQAKQWKLLEENIVLLAKRRSQLKQARCAAQLTSSACHQHILEEQLRHSAS
jgi:26S proteasome regulatory subunit N5